MQQTIKIGTRGSVLALAQANDVKAKLVAAHADLTDESIEIVVIKTTGDIILDRHLMTAGGKGLFTKELEDALLSGDIDCAVHSSKDMPTSLPDGLALTAFLPREDVRDVFISPRANNFMGMQEGATLGTASLRRRALALRLRPDLNVVTFRGNVQTRLRKLNEGQAEATFLARAGLNRMGMEAEITETLSLDDFPPAPAQGAVTVEIKDTNTHMQERLAPLHCLDTAAQVTAERAFLASLDGSCRTPIAAVASLSDDMVTLRALLLSLDGTTVFEETGTSDRDAGAALGDTLGQKIRAQAGPEFFETLKREIEATIE
ncbi:porphobilinogen deaminase [Kordiimonas sediminis]|uniref:Porphobilinogen deaminase n=1 Tax=Kordiimonas sediminis TaxID=1735581 RepID=A0A919ALC9_9PROT|nr:hydroxymethylbilane synthase [Kordiimonas sediminis]GHF13057.1 porphobilinogen deaminase [Kordiimonas sediminis]